MAQAASKTCEICTRASGSHYCCECEQLFCEECKTAHLRSKVCRNHQFLSGPNIQPKPKVGCPDHNEDYIFYCVPCDTPVCKICMTDSHNSHKVKALPAVISEVKSDFEKQLQLKVENLQSSISKVKEGSHLLNKDVEETIRSLQKQGEEVKNAIDKEVNKLVLDVRERSNKEMQQLSDAAKDFNSMLDQGNKLQKEYGDASKTKHDVGALNILQRLLNDCRSIQTFAIPKIPSIKHTKSAVLQQDIASLLGSVNYEEGIIQKSGGDIPNAKLKYGKARDDPIKGKRISDTKQYKYQCDTCRTEIMSEKKPIQGGWKRQYLYCPKCGPDSFCDFLE